MRILLFGKNGQVGWELQRTLVPLGETIAADYPEIDFQDLDGLRSFVEANPSDLIVNAAAYTNVDKAEEQPETARLVNAEAPGLIAEMAKRQGAGLIHYSTDYVFDGTKGSPYTENDQPNPLNVYGQTKLEGEQAVQSVGGAFIILRTSWVYSMRMPCFARNVLEWARERQTLRIVDDQVGSPTWCRMLAQATSILLTQTIVQPRGWLSEHAGLYHLAGDGSADRYEFAEFVIANDPQKREQRVQDVLRAKTDDFPTPAKRPLFSALDCSRFKAEFGFKLPAWSHTVPLALDSV